MNPLLPPPTSNSHQPSPNSFPPRPKQPLPPPFISRPRRLPRRRPMRAADLQTDIATVTTRTPTLIHDEKSLAKTTLLIGTLGNKSPLIDHRLIREKKSWTPPPSPASGNPTSPKRSPTPFRALTVPSSSSAATNAAPSTASTKSPNKWASLPGIGGPMSPLHIRTISSSNPAATYMANPASNTAASFSTTNPPTSPTGSANNSAPSPTEKKPQSRRPARPGPANYRPRVLHQSLRTTPPSPRQLHVARHVEQRL